MMGRSEKGKSRSGNRGATLPLIQGRDVSRKKVCFPKVKGHRMKTQRRKSLLLVLSIVMLVSFLGLFVSSQLLNAQNNKYKSRNFVDSSSNNFPPMNVLDKDGNLTGFGRDLADAVVKAIDGKVTHIHSGHWGQVLEWLDSGKADFIHDTGYTKDRDEFLDYSDPIIEMPEVIFVRPDQYDIRGLNSLKGKTVACVNKHITHLYLQEFPEINCYVVKTPVEGLCAVEWAKAAPPLSALHTK